MENLRARIRSIPVLGKFALFVYIFLRQGSTLRILNPSKELSNFWPNSDGKFKVLTELLLHSLNNIPRYFDELLNELGIWDLAGELEPKTNFEVADSNQAALKRLFQKYKSDKHTHEYDKIYGQLFGYPENVARVIEIGIGTNNESVVSHMGKNHDGVGGSLRAFRDFFPNANVIGLDIDKKVLFVEDRITTYFFDQNGPSSQLEELGIAPESADLFIDDGLHLFGANVKGLIHGLRYVKPGGWIAIEDLTENALGAWNLIGQVLRNRNHNAQIIRAKNAYLFLVRKSAESYNSKDQKFSNR